MALTKRQLQKAGRIAAEVREVMESLEKDYGCRGQDLAGMCSLASHLLQYRLARAGLPAVFVQGYYAQYEHCWVYLDGIILDVTATQFEARGAFPKIHICPRLGPAGRRYKTERRGLRAVRFIRREWGAETLVNGHARWFKARRIEIPPAITV